MGGKAIETGALDGKIVLQLRLHIDGAVHPAATLEGESEVERGTRGIGVADVAAELVATAILAQRRRERRSGS